MCRYYPSVLPHTNINDFMHLSPVILVLLGALNGKIHWVNNLLTDPPRHATMELFLKMKGEPCLQTHWVLGSYNLQNVHFFFYIRSALTVEYTVQIFNAFLSLITNRDLGGC